MKKPSLLLIGILLFLFLTGCTSIKRFKSATYKSQDNSLVDMDLFGSRLSSGGTGSLNKNLWGLSASAQTQMIQILNERYPDNSQFLSTLSKEYLPHEEVGALDLTSKSLRMVFTIRKKRNYQVINDASARFSPADRIQYLTFSLKIPEKYNLHFKEWNKFTTEYGELEIADVSFSRSFSLDVDGTLAHKSEVSGKGTLVRTEKQVIKSRFMKLNGSINDLEISIEEEGTRDIDLTGNVMADVSLKFEGFPERLTIPLFAGSGVEDPGRATVAGVSFVDVLVPRMQEIPDSIKAILRLDYIYRHVQSGWKTYQEWDDQVEYYSGSLNKEVVLFTKKDFLPGFYGIGTAHGGKPEMKIRAGNGVDYLLQFRDYLDARRFLEWLSGIEAEGGTGSELPVTLGRNMLYFEGSPFTAGMGSKLELNVLPIY